MRKFFTKPWVLWTGVGLAVAVVLARFLLVFAEFNGHPDPWYFWKGAEELAQTGGLSDYYYAVFPYMTGYIGLLSVFFGWLGVGDFGVVLLNMLLWAVGAVALYFLVRGVTGSWRKGAWATVIWCFNPFHFVFSGLALPIVAFDSALLVCALVGWWMWRERRNLYKFLMLSSLLGVAMAVAGWFRPTISVLLVALVIFYGWGLVRDKFRGWGWVLAGLAIVGGVFWGGTRLTMLYAEKVTGAAGLDNHMGWSVFVGSGEVNNGGWNEEDAEVFWNDYLLNGYSIAEANDAVMRLGIERYVERGVWGNAGFVGRKAWRLVGCASCAAYYYVEGWSAGWMIFVWGGMWVLGCWVLFARGIVKGWRWMMRGGFLLLPVLLVFGMFSSGLLVEVMDRYFIPVLAVMFLCGVLWYNGGHEGA